MLILCAPINSDANLIHSFVKAELLIRELVGDLDTQILLDCSNLNPYANYLLSSLGFEEISKTYRMYKGIQPPCPMNQVYGLACLELGWFPLTRSFPLLFL